MSGLTSKYEKCWMFSVNTIITEHNLKIKRKNRTSRGPNQMYKPPQGIDQLKPKENKTKISLLVLHDQRIAILKDRLGYTYFSFPPLERKLNVYTLV